MTTRYVTFFQLQKKSIENYNSRKSLFQKYIVEGDYFLSAELLLPLPLSPSPSLSLSLLSQWGYFSNTVVYSFRKPEKAEHCLVFWNTKTGEKNAKAVKNLLHVTACKDLALLVAKVDDSSSEVFNYVWRFRVCVCMLER